MTSISTESRVPLAERNEVPVEVAILYDKLLADRGVVPNMFKALANAPDLVLGIAAFLRGLMGDSVLRGWYKELIATRVASLNRLRILHQRTPPPGREARRHARAGGGVRRV